MDLPRFKQKDGSLVELTWTRLKSVAEVKVAEPAPPVPTWRPGLAFGPDRIEEEGRGFDRRKVITKPVVGDDGLHNIGGKVVRGRPRTGEALSYEPARAWTHSDLAAAQAQAHAILRQHDFPVDLEWPEPSAWVWQDEGLWWAVAPEGDWFVYDDGREEPSSMSGVYRGGLGWPKTDREPDQRAARLWPRFSPFGWALEVFDASNFLNGAKGTLCRLAEEARRHGHGIDDESVVGPACATWPVRDADHLWSLGFAAGAYLAEYRLRALYAAMLERGEDNQLGNSKGGKLGGGAKAAAKADSWRKEIFPFVLDLRKRYPDAGGPWIEAQVRKRFSALTALMPLKLEKTFQKWEREGALPRSTVNRTADPSV